MSTNLTTTTNLTPEPIMDRPTEPAPTGRPLTSAEIRRLRADMDAKIASFEQLGDIGSRTRMVLDAVDEECDAEWRRARRTARANRLAGAAVAISSFRGGE
jgi:hypothetical protein